MTIRNKELNSLKLYCQKVAGKIASMQSKHSFEDYKIVGVDDKTTTELLGLVNNLMLNAMPVKNCIEYGGGADEE